VEGADSVKSFHDLAETINRLGIDPAAPTVEPPPFDPVAFRVEQAEMVLAAIVPNRFRNATVDHPLVARWVARFLTREPGCRSLLLAGERGTGKSHLGYAALREIALHAARHRPPVNYRAVTHPQFNDAMRPKSDNSHESAIDPYLAADLLLFDDLGAGRQTEWTADSLIRLVDHRWSEDLPTIYTTNLDPEALESAVGPRVLSRVFDAYRIQLEGDDRRQGDAL
jgi:DNA replication protein DnaC